METENIDIAQFYISIRVDEHDIIYNKNMITRKLMDEIERRFIHVSNVVMERRPDESSFATIYTVSFRGARKPKGYNNIWEHNMIKPVLPDENMGMIF